jgi:hypothetical protein
MKNWISSSTSRPANRVYVIGKSRRAPGAAAFLCLGLVALDPDLAGRSRFVGVGAERAIGLEVAINFD